MTRVCTVTYTKADAEEYLHRNLTKYEWANVVDHFESLSPPLMMDLAFHACVDFCCEEQPSGFVVCDDCGANDITDKAYYYASLPVDISSANKGESAVLCRECKEKHFGKQMERPNQG